MSDAGQYECQLTTHPPVSYFFTLKVTRKSYLFSLDNKLMDYRINESNHSVKKDVTRHDAGDIFI